MTLAPTLTRLDEAVLRAVPYDRGIRLLTIWLKVNYHRDEDRYESTDDVRLVLRGLEHLGHITNSHGWWRRVA